MTDLNDRRRLYENRYALDEVQLFKAEARACKQFGLWLADKLELEGDDAQNYAARLVTANLEEPGFDDVVRHVRPDIDAKSGFEMSDAEIHEKIGELFILAQTDLKNENG